MPDFSTQFSLVVEKLTISRPSTDGRLPTNVNNHLQYQDTPAFRRADEAVYGELH
jgi:hypothetical protein